MTGHLGIYAYVVQRAGRDGRDDIARVSTRSRRRAEISALTSGYRSDDEPDHDDEPSDSHIYLRKTGSSYTSEEPQTRDISSSTPSTADTRSRRIRCAVHWHLYETGTGPAFGFRRRCIVSADGPGWHDRAGRTCGTRSARPSAGRPAGARRPMASSDSRTRVVPVHH